MIRPRFARVSAAALALLPAIAAAHPGHYHPGEEDEFDAFAAGALHPLGGIDHLLLALAAGWIAARAVRERRGWTAAVFLLALVAGMAAGMARPALPGMELMIAATVLAAGGVIALLKDGGFRGVSVLLGVCGFIHGFAHGAEAPGGGSFLFYASGIALATAGLCVCGWIAAIPSRAVAWMPRTLGATLVVAGAVLAGHAL